MFVYVCTVCIKMRLYTCICMCVWEYCLRSMCVSVCVYGCVSFNIFVSVCQHIYVCVPLCICVSMCISVSLCMCLTACVYVCLCVCICLSAHMCVPMYVCLCVSMCLYVCVWLCVSMSLCVCAYVCLSICLCLCACVCMCERDRVGWCWGWIPGPQTAFNHCVHFLCKFQTIFSREHCAAEKATVGSYQSQPFTFPWPFFSSWSLPSSLRSRGRPSSLLLPFDLDFFCLPQHGHFSESEDVSLWSVSFDLFSHGEILVSCG